MRIPALAMILLLAVLGISGCSTISKEECQVGDWAGIGERDGAKGKNQSQFYKYVKECGEYGVEPSHDLYKQGYSEGLKRFCTPENGWSYGRAGKAYHNNCPKELSVAFLKNYNQGQKVYKVHQEISRIRSSISDLDRKITEEEDKLTKSGITGAEVVVGGVRIDKLRREKLQHEDRIRQLKEKANNLESGYRL